MSFNTKIFKNRGTTRKIDDKIDRLIKQWEELCPLIESILEKDHRESLFEGVDELIDNDDFCKNKDYSISPDQLSKAGQLLYGEDWFYEFAKLMGWSSENRVHELLNGSHEMPKIKDGIIDLLKLRISDIDKLIWDLEK